MNYKYSIVTLFFITFLSLPAMDHQWKPQSFAQCVKVIKQDVLNDELSYPAASAMRHISQQESPYFIGKHKDSPEYAKFQNLNLIQFTEKLEKLCDYKDTQGLFERIQSQLAPHNRTIILTQKQINANPVMQKQLETQNSSHDSLKRQPSLDMRQKRAKFLSDDPEKALLEQQKIAQGILLNNTKNYRAEQQTQQRLAEKRQKELNEQFKKHIETISQWNAQEEYDTPGKAGHSILSIAEMIESFVQSPVCKDTTFQNLDLSKLLAACSKFNYYTNTLTSPVSKLQQIRDSLAPHNASVKLPDAPQQPVIVEHPSDNPMIETQSSFVKTSSFAEAMADTSSFAKASADTSADKGNQLLHETPEDKPLNNHQPEPDQAKEEQTLQATDHKEQATPQQIDLPEEAQTGNLIPQVSPALLPQEEPELTEENKALKVNDQQKDNAASNIPEAPNQPDLSVPSEQPASLTPENPNIVTNQKTAEKTEQPEQETRPLGTPIPHEQPATPRKDNLEATTASEISSMQPNSNNQQEPKKMALSTPFYKKPFFWGIGLCTILAAIYCHKHYKEVIIDCFNNRPDILTYLRSFLSPVAT